VGVEPDNDPGQEALAAQRGGPSVSEVATDILVEFRRGGFEEMSRLDLSVESARAVSMAMDTIRSMGERVSATVQSLVHRPTQAEVTFGITLDAQAGALLAKASAGASIEVKLTWDLSGGHENAG
jgi:hypothetical protein